MDSSRKQIVGITSWSSRTELDWLMELLNNIFSELIASVRYITVGAHTWREEVDRCSLVILYHSAKYGRLNITDTGSALYNEELLYLSQHHGPNKVLVVLDDVEFTDEEEKKGILLAQPLIALCSGLQFLVPKEDKDSVFLNEIDTVAQFLKGGTEKKPSEKMSQDVITIPSNPPSKRSQLVRGRVDEPPRRKNTKPDIPCSQKHSVKVFSRAAKSSYTWLLDLLRSKDFGGLVKEVHAVELSNNYSQFLSNINNCTFAILYHTLKFGRINITDVTDSIYDKELRDLYHRLGREKIIVVIDDLLESSLEKTKSMVLQNQLSIGQYSQEAFFFSEREKKCGIFTSAMQDKIRELRETIENCRAADPTPTEKAEERQQDCQDRRGELQPGTRDQSELEVMGKEMQRKDGGLQPTEGPNMGSSCATEPKGARAEADRINTVSQGAADPTPTETAEERQQDCQDRRGEFQPGTRDQRESEVMGKEMESKDGGPQTTEGAAGETLRRQLSIEELAQDLIWFTVEEKRDCSETVQRKLERIRTFIIESAEKMDPASSNDTPKKQMKETYTGHNCLEYNDKSLVKKIEINETDNESEMCEGSSITTDSLTQKELRKSENSLMYDKSAKHQDYDQLENKRNHYERMEPSECDLDGHMKHMGNLLAKQQKTFKMYSEIQEKCIHELQQIQDLMNDLQNTINKQAQEIEMKNQIIKEQAEKIEEQNQEMKTPDNKNHFLREPSRKIEEQNQKIGKQDQIIKEQVQKIEERDQIIKEQAQKIQEQYQRIGKQDQIIKEQFQKIEERNQKIKEQARKIEEQNQEMRTQDNKIKDQDYKIRELCQKTEEQTKKVGKQDQKIKNQAQKTEGQSQRLESHKTQKNRAQKCDWA
ncbi:golgin subfamily A member 6-like protein 22 isoform X1 [Xenopus tropicalis]|uniref:Golgin subfamily A member 6-like protein 22 n=1 Tax=Xenopus tropicalis TaxID=8364 RepID=A0A803JZW3_XENTR|nr:golgin subfamily A member 6-like protein 22 isoform X1 [Xenopus tropicalis]